MERSQALELLLAKRGEFGAFVRRRVKIGADAEDLVQQAFVKALRTVDTLDDAACLESWFFQVLRNVVTDHLRGEMRQMALLAAQPEKSPPRSFYEMPGCACSLSLLAELPEQYQEILRRVDVLEEPLERVASELQLTSNNASVRLHRARKALRTKLAHKCGTTSTSTCAGCACATAS